MFELLVACQPRGSRAGALRGGMASFVLHSALILGAVAATTRTGAGPVDPHPVVPILFQVPPGRHVPPPPRLPGLPVGSLVLPTTLTISSIVPTQIPPPSTAPFDPFSFSHVTGPDPSGAAPDTTTAGVRAVYAARWVDDEPVLLSHPAVAYPEILRRAGISGRAMVEVVIDSTGHVERGSIRVLSSTQPLLGQPAADVVAASVYRPGKVNGRAVRVRVQVPVDFQVAARATSM